MKRFLILTSVLFAVLSAVIIVQIRIPPDLWKYTGEIKKPVIVSRDNVKMNATFRNELNLQDVIAVQDIPGFIKTAFITAEDRRFYEHSGIDLKAKAAALFSAARNFKFTRGGSTISEQVVKMLHKRKRTVLTKLIEMAEAVILEQRNSKDEILAFYINQVPFARNLRGIQQASGYYFSRDADTLNKKEILALAVLVRAPSRLDLKKDGTGIENKINRLAAAMYKNGQITIDEFLQIANDRGFRFSGSQKTYNAEHFTAMILKENTDVKASNIQTTLDSGLQSFLNSLLKSELKRLKNFNVKNAAAVIVEVKTGEILAYVSSGTNSTGDESCIDAVKIPRSPGSALKPFIYALSFEKGLNGATLVKDEKISEKKGSGVHVFRNYSEKYYGTVSLREALGNSLNTPAVKLTEFVKEETLYKFFSDAGINLEHSAQYYGSVLGIGGAYISLFDLVRLYLVLADGGSLKELRYTSGTDRAAKKRLLSCESTGQVTDILKDSSARQLEFGNSTVLNFSSETAVKTGTSSRYHDAWTVGYNSNYVAGIWFGNLDFTPTKGLSGAKGPAFTLRTIFSELNKRKRPAPLTPCERLSRKRICYDNGICKDELINPSFPVQLYFEKNDERIIFPTEGLKMAVTPARPREVQAVDFEVSAGDFDKIEWEIDGNLIAVTTGTGYLWTLIQGNHRLCVRKIKDGSISNLGCVNFSVD